MSDYIIASLLAIIQGITEFLPISSSAHLILPSQLLDIPDQGLLFDAAVHGGTLIAVCIYYRQDILMMIKSWTLGIKDSDQKDSRYFALWLVIATIPVLAVGYVYLDFISSQLRNTMIIAITTIVFGLLLWWAARGEKLYEKPNPWTVLLCGAVQVLALVPGVSRSGITITMAMALGLKGEAAARLSFLLSVPVIGSAFAYSILKIIQRGDFDGLLVALWGAFLAGIFAYLTIGVFISLLNRVGMTPFVVYRLMLGLLLLLFSI